MTRILLVEDNPLTAKGLQYLLEREKYQVTVAQNIRAARELLPGNFDLLLLDVSLPDGDGIELAKSIKSEAWSKGMGLIFLTAKDREEDIVRGLEIGANDYIVKPFHNRELLLRIRNTLCQNKSTNDASMTYGRMTYNPTTREVVWRGEKVSLTALEGKILTCLLEMPEQITTREKLLDEIWEASGSIVNDNTVSVYIKRLREKLGADTIRTVKNLGYKLDLEDK